jgi:hypothetical protein
MLSSKADEQSAEFDTFSCLNCKTIITLPPRRRALSQSSERGLGLNSMRMRQVDYFASVLMEAAMSCASRHVR